METKKALANMGTLEKELGFLRKHILETEGEILALEKKMFESEHQHEKTMQKEAEHSWHMQNQTELKIKTMEKEFGQKITHLTSKTKEQKIANAVLEQQLLQRELESLQAGFKKELQKAKKG